MSEVRIGGEHAANSPWSTVTPKFQVVWDSTSLGWLKECPAYYHFQMILQMQPRTKGVHLMFGQLYALGCETYAKHRANGMDHRGATREMVRTVLLAAGTRDEQGTWHPWEPPPEHRDASIKNRYTLIRSLVWNVEDRLDSPFQVLRLADGKAAVELSFEFPAFEIAGETISLSGHLDSLVENRYDRTRFVSDDKTTKSPLNAQYFNQYSPNNQMSLYSVAGKVILNRPVAGVLVRAAQILVEGTRFTTQQVNRPPQVLDEWMEDTEYWISRGREFALANRWPRNDRACIDGEAIIKVSRGTMKGRKTTLREFYEYFHGWRFEARIPRSIPARVLSDLGGYVGLADIEDVLFKGKADTQQLQTSKHAVWATEDHLFRHADGEWVQLKDLREGDSVFGWSDRKDLPRQLCFNREAIYSIPHHPFAQQNWVKGKNYKRVWKSRAVIEAAMNGLSVEEWTRILRKDPARAATLQYLPKDVEIHHRDRNVLNDSFDNLEVLAVGEHHAEHREEAIEASNRLMPERIVSISGSRFTPVYDLVVKNSHNFIADGIVVHNCGNYGGCPFQKVCARIPAHRAAWLREDFVKLVWNPAESRGEMAA